jgi:hypothetical protein
MTGNDRDMINNPSEEKPNASYRLLDNITEASKNARQIYFLYMGFLAYCTLTVFGTFDRQIVLNKTTSLPIIGMDVSLNAFYIASPIIIILVFVYFQLYLLKLRSLIEKCNDEEKNISIHG